MPNREPADLRLIEGTGSQDNEALFRAAIETVLARSHNTQCEAFAPLADIRSRSVFWRQVVDVALQLDRDSEHTERLRAMRSGRHPAGRDLDARYAEISAQTPAG